MKVVSAAVAFLLAASSFHCDAFVPTQISRARKSRFALSSASVMDDLTFSPPDVSEIEEDACVEAAGLMKRVAVPISTDISSTGSVGISYVHWPSSQTKKSPPIILVHGFDSSCLEFRRLGPKLAELGTDVYAVDVLGWGFTQLDGVEDFSANAKVEALASFYEAVLGDNNGVKPVVAGASLGGAVAIEFAAAYPDSIQGLVLLDAQGFVDGVGPMASLPKPIAQLGVQVLKSVPLRSSANQMSYFNKEVFATDDAVKVGRLHCTRDGWDSAMVSYMLDGGFSPSSKVETIQAPSLVLWGRQDGILDGEEFANKFVETMPDARLQWIEECGHVPHLEKAEETASVIASFLQSEKFEQPSEGLGQYTRNILLGAGGVTALTGAAAAIAVNALNL